MKNIFFAIHEYSGANTYAEQLKNFFAGQKEVCLYIVHFGSMLYKEFTVVEGQGVLMFHFPFPGKRDLKIYSRRVVDLLSPWVKGKENLIFHLNSPNQHFLGQEVKDRFGAKIVFTIHFLMSHFTSCEEEDTYGRGDFQDCTGNKETIALADRVICVTRLASRVAESYFQKSKEKIDLIYNGYGRPEDVTLLTPSQKKTLKKRLGFGEREKLILYVGRIDEAKGCEKLIQAMEGVIAVHSEVRLVLVGGGNHGECLKHVGLNCAKISFAGHLSTEKLEQLYLIADIGVIPSLWEQCSYVAIEMMAHGLPVVYSGVPGLRELFTDRLDGVQIPFYRDASKYKLSVNSQDITDALNELIDCPTKTREIGRRARKTWQEKYARERMGERILNLYRELQ